MSNGAPRWWGTLYPSTLRRQKPLKQKKDGNFVCINFAYLSPTPIHHPPYPSLKFSSVHPTSSPKLSVQSSIANPHTIVDPIYHPPHPSFKPKSIHPSSQNFHSNSFLFLLNFFFAMWGSLLLPCGCGCRGSSASWLWSCHGCGGSMVSGHVVGVGCHGFYFCSCGWFSWVIVSWFWWLWWWAVWRGGWPVVVVVIVVYYNRYIILL